MPELPEVELVARSLNTIISGRSIVLAKLLRARLAPRTTLDHFESSLSGAGIVRVYRRGKHVLIELDNENTLIVHLRMSGRFSVIPQSEDEAKFAHAIFYLDDGDKIVFNDQRHFGMMNVVASSQLFSTRELAKLAPEPFSDEFTVGYLAGVCRSSRRNLKEFLLDQTKVCGLGNIYACEAMFSARVSPLTSPADLSASRLKRLYTSIREVLRQAVEHSTDSPVDPTNLEGSYFSGSSDHGWLVYDREGQPCSRCKRPIIRVKQGGRSTFYCRSCQR